MRGLCPAPGPDPLPCSQTPTHLLEAFAGEVFQARAIVCPLCPFVLVSLPLLLEGGRDAAPGRGRP